MSDFKIIKVDAWEPDPEYELVPEPPKPKKGIQCGKCGMKFDYGVTYGYCCGNQDCPTGWGGHNMACYVGTINSSGGTDARN